MTEMMQETTGMKQEKENVAERKRWSAPKMVAVEITEVTGNTVGTGADGGSAFGNAS